MKVAYVTMRFPLPSETFACNDIQALIGMGHEVEVFCLREKHKDHDALVNERGLQDIAIHHVSLKSTLYFFVWVLIHPLMFLSVFFWNLYYCLLKPKHLLKSLALFPAACLHFHSIQTKRPDVVHLFWGHYTSLTGYLVSRFMSTTVLTQFLGAHDLVTDYPACFQLAANVDGLFTHSASNIRTIERKLCRPRSINVVFRGTKVERMASSHLMKFDDMSAPVFMTACRLIEAKGVFEVLGVFARVHSVYPSAKLLIAGDGADRARLESRVQELNLKRHVHFLGHIAQSELIQYMSQLHVFMLLSRYASERLPNVVKEAMCQECVVFTTQTDGIEELINSPIEGVIIKDDALAMLDNTVVAMLADKESMKTIASAARTKITKGFDVNACMAKYVDFWQEQLCLKKR